MSQLPAPGKPPTHIGELVRRLRQAADLTRRQFGEQTHLLATTILNLETARHAPTPAILRQLLQHSAMATLPDLAKAAGLSLDLEDKDVAQKSELP